MPYFETTAGRVFAVVQGEGPPVVLLHGFPLTHRMWREQMVPLSANHQLIVPDFPGFGQTSLAKDSLSIDDYAIVTFALLDVIAPQQPVHVAGLSMGGYIAMGMLRQAADRIRSLALLNTKREADSAEAAQKRLAMADKLLVEGSRVAAEAMMPIVMAPDVNEDRPALFDFVRDLMISQAARGLAVAQRAMASRPDSTELLAKCSVSVLVVAGSEDKITPPQGMAEMARDIPGSQFVTIADAGHLSPLEKPVAVNEALLSHFQRCR
ncbi:alpha/beta hydrolase fold protein [Planctopirus limnophila DSM 3776]|uniref:Alpha/beta hydrolase fold protein n=1 Tax=Planctopirus limnophila (strain ATCC 43296 / DSM 3776 / IFAM 1008 / Mu 290) TaxID=521674 RepID=D5STZ9_PLAL2|nr:alpha/beta fold hydrolase [Planctopirus limnophila]ADG66984.1 alpha/beta hydrolase fold protein [Planctopirus limnophila DSM 3776]